MNNIIHSLLLKISHVFGTLAGLFYLPSIHEKRVAQWNTFSQGKDPRTEYNLNKNSLVIDVGGYKGDWASDIFSRYQSTIHIFEPVHSFYEEIRKRFANNPYIHVVEAGLSDQEKKITINVDFNNSSAYKTDATGESVKLLSARDYFTKHAITNIDLIKINIEGGEYDLLEDLIKSGFIKHIRNIQVQFHDFVPNADSRMRKIKEDLRKTHYTTYEHEYVWENWTLK